jgi:hypothetical protein
VGAEVRRITIFNPKLSCQEVKNEKQKIPNGAKLYSLYSLGGVPAGKSILRRPVCTELGVDAAEDEYGSHCLSEIICRQGQ